MMTPKKHIPRIYFRFEVWCVMWDNLCLSPEIDEALKWASRQNKELYKIPKVVLNLRYNKDRHGF